MDLLDITIIIIVLTFSTATVTGNSTILTINGFYQIWKLHLFRVQHNNRGGALYTAEQIVLSRTRVEPVGVGCELEQTEQLNENPKLMAYDNLFSKNKRRVEWINIKRDTAFEGI